MYAEASNWQQHAGHVLRIKQVLAYESYLQKVHLTLGELHLPACHMLELILQKKRSSKYLASTANSQMQSAPHSHVNLHLKKWTCIHPLPSSYIHPMHIRHSSQQLGVVVAVAAAMFSLVSQRKGLRKKKHV